MAGRERRSYPLEFTKATGKQDSWDPRYGYQFLVPRAGARGIWDADLAEGWRNNFEGLRSLRHMLMPNSFLGDGIRVRGRIDGTPLSGVHILDDLVSMPRNNFFVTGTELTEDVKRERFYEGARRGFLQGYEVVPTEHMLYDSADVIAVGASSYPENVNGLLDHNRVLNPRDADGTRPGLGWGGPLFADDQRRQCHSTPAFRINASAAENGWHASFIGTSPGTDANGVSRWWTENGIVVTKADAETVLTPRGGRFLVPGERVTAFGYMTISTPKPVTGDFVVGVSGKKKIKGRADQTVSADTSASVVRVSSRESGLSQTRVVNSFPLVGVMYNPYNPAHRVAFTGSADYKNTESEGVRFIDRVRPLPDHEVTPDYWDERGTYRCDSSGNYESAEIKISADEESWSWNEIVPQRSYRFMWIQTDERIQSPYDPLRPVEIRFTNDGRSINLLTTIRYYPQGDLSSGPEITTLRGSFSVEASPKQAAQIIAAHLGEVSLAGLNVRVMPGERSIKLLPDGENTRWVQVFSGLHKAWAKDASKTSPKNKELITLSGTGARTTSIPFKIAGDDEPGDESRDFGGKSSVWTFAGGDELVTAHAFTHPSTPWKDGLYLISAKTGIVQVGPISGITGGEIASITMVTAEYGLRPAEYTPPRLDTPDSAPYNYVQNSSEVMSPGYPLWIRGQSPDAAGRKNTGDWSYTRPVNWGKAQISRRLPHKLFQAVPPGWEAKPGGEPAAQWPLALENSGLYFDSGAGEYQLLFPTEPNWDGTSEIRNWPIMTSQPVSFMVHNGCYPLMAIPNTALSGFYSATTALGSSDTIRLTTFEGADSDTAERGDGLPERGTYHPWSGNPFAGARFSQAIRDAITSTMSDYEEGSTIEDIELYFGFKRFLSSMAGNQIELPASGNDAVLDPGVAPDIARLTPDDNNQLGVMWYKERVSIDVFDTTFRFRLHKDDGSPTGGPADGFAFVIQNDADGVDAVGGIGGNLGYQGIENSVAIEFDNYFNSEMGETSASHVAVQSYGAQPNNPSHNFVDPTFGPSNFGYADLAIDLNDEEEHTARIKYNGKTLEVYLDDLQTPVMVLDIDIPTLCGSTDGKAYVGFTAATGGWSNNHDMYDWIMAESLEYESSVSYPANRPIDVLYGVAVNNGSGSGQEQYSYVFHLRAQGWVAVYDPNDAGYQSNDTEVWMVNTYCVNSWSNDPNYVHGDPVDVSAGFHFGSRDGRYVPATFAMPFSTHLEYDAVGERMDLVILDNYLREVDEAEDPTLAPPNRVEATFSRAKLITEVKVFENAVSTNAIGKLFSDVSEKRVGADEITDGFDEPNPWPDMWAAKNRWYNALNGIAPSTSHIFDLGEVPLVRKNAYLVYNEGDDVRRRQHVITPIAVISRPTTNLIPYNEQELGDRGVGPDSSVEDSLKVTFGSGGCRKNLVTQVTLDQPIVVDSKDPYVLNFWDFPYPYPLDMLERYDLITLRKTDTAVKPKSKYGNFWRRRASDVPDRGRGIAYNHRSGLDMKNDSLRYSMVVFAEFVGPSDGALNIPQEYCIIIRGKGGITHTSAADEPWKTNVKLTFPEGQRPVPVRRKDAGRAGKNVRSDEQINPLKSAKFDDSIRSMVMTPADGYYLTRIMGYMYIDMLPGTTWEDEFEFDVSDELPTYHPEWIWDELITDLRDVTPRTALGEIIRSLERTPLDPEEKGQERRINMQPSTAISAVGVVPDGGSVFSRGAMESYGLYPSPAPGVLLDNNQPKISIGNESIERYTFYGSSESCSTNHHEAVMRFHLDVGHQAYGQAGRIVDLGLQLFATQKAGVREYSGQGKHTSWVKPIRTFEDYINLYYGGAEGGPGGARITNKRFQDPSSLGLGKTGDPVRDWLQNNWVPTNDTSIGADGNRYASNWTVMAFEGPSQGQATEDLTTWPLFWFDQVNAEARAMHGTPDNYSPSNELTDSDLVGTSSPGSYVTEHVLSTPPAVINGVVAEYEDLDRVPIIQPGAKYTVFGQIKNGDDVKGYFTVRTNGNGSQVVSVEATPTATNPKPNPAGSNTYDAATGTVSIEWSADVTVEWPIDDQIYDTAIDYVRYQNGSDPYDIYQVVDNDLSYDNSAELDAADDGKFYVAGYYVDSEFRIFDTDGTTVIGVTPHMLLRFDYDSETVSTITPGTPIAVTTSAAHGLETGMTVSISGVGGTTGANGNWRITKTGASTFTLDGSSDATGYTTGGVVKTGRYTRVETVSSEAATTKIYVQDENNYYHWAPRPAGFLPAEADQTSEFPIQVDEGQNFIAFLEDEDYENLQYNYPTWIDFNTAGTYGQVADASAVANYSVAATDTLLTVRADANTGSRDRQARVVAYRRNYRTAMKNRRLAGFNLRTFQLDIGNTDMEEELIFGPDESTEFTGGAVSWYDGNGRPNKMLMMGTLRSAAIAGGFINFYVDGTPTSPMSVNLNGATPAGWTGVDFFATGSSRGLFRVQFNNETNLNAYSDLTMDVMWADSTLSTPTQFGVTQAAAPGNGWYSRTQGGGWISGLPSRLPDASFSVPSPCFPVYPVCLKHIELREYSDQGPVRRGALGGFPDKPTTWRKLFSIGDKTSSSPQDWALSGQLARSKPRLNGDDSVSIYECDGSYISPSGTNCTEIRGAVNYKAILANLAQSPDPYIDLPNDARGFFAWGDRIYQGSLGNPHRYLELRVTFANLPSPFIGNAFYDGTPFTGGGRGAYSTQLSWHGATIERPDGYRMIIAPVEADGNTIAESQDLSDPFPVPGPGELPFVGKLTATPAQELTEVLGADVVSNGDFLSGIIESGDYEIVRAGEQKLATWEVAAGSVKYVDSDLDGWAQAADKPGPFPDGKRIIALNGEQENTPENEIDLNWLGNGSLDGGIFVSGTWYMPMQYLGLNNDWIVGWELMEPDHGVTDASNTSPIVITTATEHGYSTGNVVGISGVTGNTNANGNWSVTVLSDTTFELDGSNGSGAYIDGGVVTKWGLPNIASVQNGNIDYLLPNRGTLPPGTSRAVDLAGSPGSGGIRQTIVLFFESDYRLRIDYAFNRDNPYEPTGEFKVRVLEWNSSTELPYNGTEANSIVSETTFVVGPDGDYTSGVLTNQNWTRWSEGVIDFTTTSSGPNKVYRIEVFNTQADSAYGPFITNIRLRQVEAAVNVAAAGRIIQSVPTTPGDDYVLSFQYAGDTGALSTFRGHADANLDDKNLRIGLPFDTTSIGPIVSLVDNKVAQKFYTPRVSTTISSVTNPSGGAVYVVTTSGPHGLATGQQVKVSGVATLTSANGLFTVTRIDDTQFSLNGTVGTGGAGGTGGLVRPVTDLDKTLPNDKAFIKYIASWITLKQPRKAKPTGSVVLKVVEVDDFVSGSVEAPSQAGGSNIISSRPIPLARLFEGKFPRLSGNTVPNNAYSEYDDHDSPMYVPFEFDDIDAGTGSTSAYAGKGLVLDHNKQYVFWIQQTTLKDSTDMQVWLHGWAADSQEDVDDVVASGSLWRFTVDYPSDLLGRFGVADLVGHMVELWDDDDDSLKIVGVVRKYTRSYMDVAVINYDGADPADAHNSAVTPKLYISGRVFDYTENTGTGTVNTAADRLAYEIVGAGWQSYFLSGDPADKKVGDAAGDVISSFVAAAGDVGESFVVDMSQSRDIRQGEIKFTARSEETIISFASTKKGSSYGSAITDVEVRPVTVTEAYQPKIILDWDAINPDSIPAPWQLNGYRVYRRTDNTLYNGVTDTRDGVDVHTGAMDYYPASGYPPLLETTLVDGEDRDVTAGVKYYYHVRSVYSRTLDSGKTETVESPQGGRQLGDTTYPANNPSSFSASQPTADQLERIYALEAWAIAGEVEEEPPSPPPPPAPPKIIPGKTTTQRGGGVRTIYFRGQLFNNVVEERTEPNVSVYWGERSPLPEINGDFSVIWIGWIKPNVSGTYQFAVAGLGNFAMYMCGRKEPNNLGGTTGVPVAGQVPYPNADANPADDELIEMVQSAWAPVYEVKEAEPVFLQADKYYWFSVNYLESGRDDNTGNRSGAGVVMTWRNLDEAVPGSVGQGGGTFRLNHSSFQLLGVLDPSAGENASWFVQGNPGSEYLQNYLPSKYGAFAVSTDADTSTGGIQPTFLGEPGTGVTLRFNGTGSADGWAGLLFGLVQGATNQRFRGLMISWDSSGAASNAISVVQLDGPSGSATDGFFLGDLDDALVARRAAMLSAFATPSTVDLGVDGRMTLLGQINEPSWSTGTHYITVSVITDTRIEISIDGGAATTLDCSGGGGTLNLTGDLDSSVSEWRALRGASGIALYEQTMTSIYLEMDNFQVSSNAYAERTPVDLSAWKEVNTDHGTFQGPGAGTYFKRSQYSVHSDGNNHERAYWMVTPLSDGDTDFADNPVEIHIRPTNADNDYIGFVFGWSESAGSVDFYQFDWKRQNQNQSEEGYRLVKFEGVTLVDDNNTSNSNSVANDSQKYIRNSYFCRDFCWDNDAPATGVMVYNSADDNGNDPNGKGWVANRWSIFLLKDDGSGYLAIYHCYLDDSQYASYISGNLDGGQLTWQRLLTAACTHVTYGAQTGAGNSATGRWGFYSHSQTDTTFKAYLYKGVNESYRPPIDLPEPPGSQGSAGGFNPGMGNDAFRGGVAGGFNFGPNGEIIPGYTYLPVPGSVLYHDEQITTPPREEDPTLHAPDFSSDPGKPKVVGVSGAGRLKKGGLKATYYDDFMFANPGWLALAEARGDIGYSYPLLREWNVKMVGADYPAVLGSTPANGDMWIDANGLINLQYDQVTVITLSADGIGGSNPSATSGFYNPTETAYNAGNPRRMPNADELDESRFHFLNQAATAFALLEIPIQHSSPYPGGGGTAWQDYCRPCFTKGWAWQVYDENTGDYYRLGVNSAGTSYTWTRQLRPLSFHPDSFVRSAIEPGITHDDWGTNGVDGVKIQGGSIKQQNFGVRWEGFLEAPSDGPIELMCKFEDGARLWIEDGSTFLHSQYNPGGGTEDFYARQTVRDWTDVWGDDEWTPIYPPREAIYTTQPLKKGSLYRLRIEFYEQGGYAHAELYWRPSEGSSSSEWRLVPQQYLWYEEKHEIPLQPKSPLRLPSINYSGNIRAGGVLAEYYDDKDLMSAPLTRVERKIDFEWAVDGSPSPLIGPETWSARWTGFIQPLRTGLYRFHSQRDDGVKLFLNETPVIDAWNLAYQAISSSNDKATGGLATDDIFLEGGRRYKMRMEFFENTGYAEVDLRWSFRDVEEETEYKIVSMADSAGEIRLTLSVPDDQVSLFVDDKYATVYRALDSNGVLIPTVTGTWQIDATAGASANGYTSVTVVLQGSVWSGPGAGTPGDYTANSGRMVLHPESGGFSYGVFAPDWQSTAAAAAETAPAFSVDAAANAAGEIQITITLDEWVDLERWQSIVSVTADATTPVVTTAENHGYTTGDKVVIYGVSGSGNMANANSTFAPLTTFTITSTGAKTFTLTTTDTSGGVYGGGGNVGVLSRVGLVDNMWIHIWGATGNTNMNGTWQIKTVSRTANLVTMVLHGSDSTGIGSYTAGSARLALVPGGWGQNAPFPYITSERFRANIKAVHEAIPVIPSDRLFYEVDERVTGLMSRGGLNADPGPGAFEFAYKDLSGKPLGSDYRQSLQRSMDRDSMVRCKYLDRHYTSEPGVGGQLVFWGVSTNEQTREFSGSDYITGYLPYSMGGDYTLLVKDPKTGTEKPGGQRPTFIGSDRVGIGTVSIGMMYDRDFFGAGPKTDGKRQAELIE